MAKRQFKAESKRLLGLMIDSIYTHKEIFLRELISNASDAIDKLLYQSLSDENLGMSRADFAIKVEVDKAARTITVSDNGIGMTGEELDQNLGVIAKSGSLSFKQGLDAEKTESGEIDIIGQFGVGFYSAFMVADSVRVISRKFGSEEASCWESTGADGYTISAGEKESWGTTIVMHIKTDTEDENYSEFLDGFTLRNLVKKYSDYIRYPIKMQVEKSRVIETGEVDDEGKAKTRYERYSEEETVNSMVPIWQRSKSEVSDEDCQRFYREKFADNEDAARVVRVSAEGLVSYKAMLFIPKKAPYNYYSRDYEPGLQLYASGVMIMEKCAELLPECFRFVRGVIDSQDLSLNISRELLQHDRQLKVIASNLEKRIKSELKKMMDEERELYLEFFMNFGPQLKYGILGDYGAKRELLGELLMFYSSREEKLVSLKEYVEAMPEGQSFIYYACGDSVARLDKLPQVEPLKERGYSVLFFTEETDEFVASMLGEFEGKPLKSVNAEDAGLEKPAEDVAENAHVQLLDFVKDALGGEVAAVKISQKLKSYPVCLSTQGAITLEMERYFNAMPGAAEKVKAERVLELNAGHRVFDALEKALKDEPERARKYAKLLYFEALLSAGVEIADPSEYTEIIDGLIV